MPKSMNWTQQALNNQFSNQWKEYDINKLPLLFTSIKVYNLIALVLLSQFRQQRLLAISEYVCRMFHLMLLYIYATFTSYAHKDLIPFIGSCKSVNKGP